MRGRPELRDSRYENPVGLGGIGLKAIAKFGVVYYEQFIRLDRSRRGKFSAHVAFNLLNIGEQPSEEQIRVFEDISLTLRTSNDTRRTTFRKRFDDIAESTLAWIRKFYAPGSRISVQDRAASHGLTSKEFAEQIFRVYPDAQVEASDILLWLIELSLPTGEIYITEPDGTPLQYIKAPFVLALYAPESWRYPVNRWMAARARRRFDELNLPSGWTKTQGGAGFSVRRIPYIHPEALALVKNNPNFRFCERSIFDRTPGACQVLRTMNIFNPAYFSEQQLVAGTAAVFDSLEPGGIWIVGRTVDESSRRAPSWSCFSNHVSFFRRTEKGWSVLGRLGDGSEMEALVLNTRNATTIAGKARRFSLGVFGHR